MTNSTVSLHGVMGSQAAAYAATQKVQSAAGEADFSQILGNATGKDNVQDTEVSTAKKKVEKDAPVEDVQKPEVKDAPKDVAESPKTEAKEIPEEDLEEAMEVIQSAALEIQQLVCETLGISEEELAQALDALGLSELDLLAMGNASKVALYVEGQNEMALLTDEGLYSMVQELEGALQQISENLLQDLNEVAPGDAEELFGEALKALKENASEEAPQINITDDRQALTVSENGQAKETAERGAKNEEGHTDSSNLFAGNQVVNNDYQQAVAEIPETETGFGMSQTQEIMDQIMDYLDVQLSNEETTLQMQLHPESLGNLHITISAKEGVMTAQFTAESEAVKAVLENQIMQLQDKFDQQNIKVEAIEISVATHGFEQNLQQGEEKDTYEEENPRPRVRKIDINSLDAVDELPEEDQVVAEMMQLHGNSIDYMA